MRRLIPIALLALALTGCGGSSTPSATTPGGGVLVRYERRGGPAHVDVAVIVRQDGRGSRTSSAAGAHAMAFTLAPGRLTALRRALERADLGHLRSIAGPAPAGAYEYTISASGRTVRFAEGRVPRSLVPVIALLEVKAFPASFRVTGH